MQLSWREPLDDMQIKSAALGSILLSDWLLLLLTTCWSVLHQARQGLRRGEVFFFFLMGALFSFCWSESPADSSPPTSYLPAVLPPSLSVSTRHQGEMSHAVSSVCASVHARSVCFPSRPERAGMRPSGGWESKRNYRIETKSSLDLTGMLIVRFQVGSRPQTIGYTLDVWMNVCFVNEATWVGMLCWHAVSTKYDVFLKWTTCQITQSLQSCEWGHIIELA